MSLPTKHKTLPLFCQDHVRMQTALLWASACVWTY